MVVHDACRHLEVVRQDDADLGSRKILRLHLLFILRLANQDGRYARDGVASRLRAVFRESGLHHVGHLGGRGEDGEEEVAQVSFLRALEVFTWLGDGILGQELLEVADEIPFLKKRSGHTEVDGHPDAAGMRLMWSVE